MRLEVFRMIDAGKNYSWTQYISKIQKIPITGKFRDTKGKKNISWGFSISA